MTVRATIQVMDEGDDFDVNSARRMAIDRLQIVDAYVVAIDRRDELWQIVDGAENSDVARDRIGAAFGLTEIQAHAVLDLQVRRFAGEERTRIKDERDELRASLT